MTQNPDDSQQPSTESEFWNHVAQLTDKLVSDWKNTQDNPPCLDSLLEKLPAEIKRPILWELIKVDLEIRWREKNMPTTLEEYVAMYPLLGSAQNLPADLIFEEYQIRRASGDPISIQTASHRFPVQQKAIEYLSNVSNRTLTFKPDQQPHPPLLSTGIHRPEMFTEGDTVDDFELILLLGAGSFARVFLARQRSLERFVAVKISADEGQEPRTLAQLEHKNIVRVYDQRSLSSGSIRLLYMELVPGGSLDAAIVEIKKSEFTAIHLFQCVDSTIQRVGAAPPVSSEWRSTLRSLEWPQVVCHLGIQLAEGLAYAHAQGVLHRDIKPANVLLTAEGVPKLADFNISFNAAGSGERPGDAFGGSLAYMSPEQLRACHVALGGSVGDVGEASDIYSLGLLLIELLTGNRVFAKPAHDTDWEASLHNMLQARVLLDRQSSGELFPEDTPDSIRHVLAGCVEHEPDHRPASAQQLVNQLKVCLNPQLWHLLRYPNSRLGRLINWVPLLCLSIATLGPMAPITVFNFFYNRQALASLFPAHTAQFDYVHWWVNLIGFPIGIAIGIFLGARAVYFSPSRESQRATDYLLQLGRDLAVLSMSLWFISGLVFPLVLHFSVPDSQDLLIFTLFMLSLTLCGLIAGTYPYLMVTYLCVRYLIPRQLNRGKPYPSLPALRSSRSLVRIFIALTAIVPMLATLLAVMFRDQQQSTLVLLSFAGIIGFIASLWAGQKIDSDLSALENHVRTQQ